MVLWSLKNTFGGEIIVPKLPSYKILDLAKAIDQNVKIEIIGIRQGEKIHEELISKADNLYTYDIGKYYVILQNNKKLVNIYKQKFNAKKTKEDFVYSSDNKTNVLNKSQLKKVFLEFKNNSKLQ